MSLASLLAEHWSHTRVGCHTCLTFTRVPEIGTPALTLVWQVLYTPNVPPAHGRYFNVGCGDPNSGPQASEASASSTELLSQFAPRPRHTELPLGPSWPSALQLAVSLQPQLCRRWNHHGRVLQHPESLEAFMRGGKGGTCSPSPCLAWDP